MSQNATIASVQTISETRRSRLLMLWRRHGESMSDLNEAIGWPRPDARLNRIKGKVRRGDRDGKYFEMGDNIAREIEQALGLPEGWMDTPPSYAELHGEDDPLSRIIYVAEKMTPEMQRFLAQLVSNMASSPAIPEFAGFTQITGSDEPRPAERKTTPALKAPVKT